MSGEKVLVTGGGGFLGQYVVEEHLRRGDQVTSLSRRAHDALANLGVEQIQADLRDREAVIAACRGHDLVQHTAAIAGIWGPWSEYQGINVVGTKHVLDGCLQAGVGRLVYTSSPSVTFNGDDQINVDEQAPYAVRFLCNYPRSKAQAEQMVLAAHEPEKLLTCALRPHLIWGPRDQHLIPRLLQRAKSGRLLRVGDGQNLIDTIYVENAALAQVLAADALSRRDQRVGGSAYFLSQGEPVKCWEWIDEVLLLAGLPKLRKGIGFKTAWFAGGTMELAYAALRKRTEPRMTRFLAAQLAKPHFFNIQRARDELGYVPRISTAEGMERLREWITARDDF